MTEGSSPSADPPPPADPRPPADPAPSADPPPPADSAPSADPPPPAGRPVPSSPLASPDPGARSLPRLRLHDTGSGAALLFLHAFPLDASQWDHQVASLSGGFRCLRPDFWGCGSSSELDEPGRATLDLYAEAVLRELDAAGVEEVVGVGASMGGHTLFALLRRAPQRLRGLVLAGTRASADTPEQAENRGRMAELALREGAETAVPMANRLLGPRARREPHIRDAVEGRIRRCRPAGIAACQRAMAARPDGTGLLAPVRVPALVIHGQQDGIVSLEEARAMAEAIPGGELAVLPEVGHLPNLEDPPGFTELLAGFLAGRLPG